MTNEHNSLEKYTSHTLFSKGLRKGCWLCVRGELETEQTATYWPQVPLNVAALLLHSAGLLNRGPEGPSPLSGAGSHSAGNCDWNWTATRTPTLKPSVAPGYIIVWHPPASCGCRMCTEFNSSTGQGDIPIFSTGCTCFLIDGSVEGQYVTLSVTLSIKYIVVVEGDPKAPFSLATTPRRRGWCYVFITVRCRGGRTTLPLISSL